VESMMATQGYTEQNVRAAKKMAEEDSEQQDTAQKTRDAKTAKRQEKLEETDEILDDIDTLLEETAIMVNYVQKGGQ
jgi:Pup-like protein